VRAFAIPGGPTKLAAPAVLAALVLTLCPATAAADTVYVPTDQPTIQAGIDAAGDGGTVYVEPDTYSGPGNRDIDFAGMNVTLVSTDGPGSTVIDGEGAYHAFYFHTYEETTCVVEGLTIRNCGADYGGAMRLQNASPTIRNCVFASNTVWSGGGAVHVSSECDARFEACTFTGNHADSYGGAVYLEGSYGSFTNCTFNGNTTDGWGAALHLRSIAETSFTDCDFTGNVAGQYGGAVYSLDAESPFTGCAFVANEASVAGAVYLQSSFNPPVFTRCSFVDNDGCGIRINSADPVITQCIFAFDRSNRGILCTGIGEPTITHSVSFGNALSDSLCGNHVSNLFEDPLLCGYSYGDIDLCGNSPCLPSGNEWSVHIGARLAGCPDCDSPVEPSTWGTLKAMYR